MSVPQHGSFSPVAEEYVLFSVLNQVQVNASCVYTGYSGSGGQRFHVPACAEMILGLKI